MCHMLADSDEELHAMAARIGMKPEWHQKPGSVHSHYDISLGKRRLAIYFGAVEINRAQLGQILKRRREALAKEKKDERVREVPVVLELPTAE
jgi:allophanate hydrolase subunit 1